MKNLRNIAAIAIIAASLTACGGNSESKSIGGSSDTGRNASSEGVSSVGGTDSTTKDTTQTDTGSQGNATPTGRP